MKRDIFIIGVISCSVFFIAFLFSDELFVPSLQQVYETALLAVILGSLGITASKYYADTSTNEVIQELKRLKSKFEQQSNNKNNT